MRIRVRVDAQCAHVVFKDLRDMPGHLVNLIVSAAGTQYSSNTSPCTLQLTFKYRPLWWSKSPQGQDYKYHLLLETTDRTLLNLKGKYHVAK